MVVVPIKFDLIGANERTRNALVMAFNGRARGSCEFAEHGEADAVIVDIDGVGARSEWSRYRHKHPRRPSVLLALSECTVPETAIVLIKPIRIEALLGAVADVRRRIETGEIDAPGATLRATPTGRRKIDPPPAIRSAPAPAGNVSPPTRSLRSQPSSQSKKPVPATPTPVDHAKAKPAPAETPLPVKNYSEVCGIAADIDCEDEALLRLRSLDAEGTLLDWMRRAVARSESTRAPVALLIQNREMVTVSAPARVGKVTVIDDILKHLCARKYPATQVVFQGATPDQLHSAENAAGEALSLEALLWKTALWTFQGRLPEGTPIRERVYLRRWPNLTRLLEVPDAMRIAALLVAQPLTLPRVAEALSIPQRNVFAFYGAAQAAGLASQAKRETDNTVVAVAMRKHAEHGFIHRVVGRLKRLVA